MISKMANTKRYITSSVSGCSTNGKTSDAEGRGVADFYLPRSIISKVNVGQINEITLQRKVTRDGRIHCSYSVRWKKSNLPPPANTASQQKAPETSKAARKHSRRLAVEEMLSKDFYDMCKLDNYDATNQARFLNRPNDHSFTETISGKSTPKSNKAKARQSCSVSTKSLSFSNCKSPGELTNSQSTQKKKSWRSVKEKASAAEPQQTARRSNSTTLASSSLSASAADSTVLGCKCTKYTATPMDNEYEMIPSDDDLKMQKSVSGPCEKELLVEFVIMEVVSGTLHSVEVGDHMCGSTKLSEVIDSFANSYTRFRSLRKYKHIYVGTYRCNSGVTTRKYKFLNEDLMNAQLYDIDDNVGIVRFYALAEIN